MKIIEKYGHLDAYRPFRDKGNIITEHHLIVYVNDVIRMRMICTPENLAELVLGKLLSDGIVSGADDVESLIIDETGTEARVTIRESIMDSFPDKRILRKVEKLEWKREWVLALEKRFEEDTKLHRMTHAVHSCFLSIDGEIVVFCEDIGRHNTLDKAFGIAIRQGYNWKRALLYTSGRVPVDMIEKVIQAGVPVLISKETPTWEAIGMARQYGVTLIGQAKKGEMVLYND